jgi:hypothetical protein
MGNAMDKVFKNATENHKVQPSPDLWAKLEGALDAQEKAPRKAYWNYAVAAALVLLVGIPAFMVVQNEGTQLYVERVTPTDLAGLEPIEDLPEITLPKSTIAVVKQKEVKLAVKQKTVVKKVIPLVSEAAELASVQAKKKKVIHAFVRPMTTLASVEIPATKIEPVIEQKKEKVTVKTLFNKLKELKRGELNLPENITFNIPKLDLFASK